MTDGIRLPTREDRGLHMKRIIHCASIFTLVTAIFSGCCSTDRVAKPSSISVVQALTDVGAGLAAMKIAELQALTNAVLGGKSDYITGLFPAEVVVTFNVTASASNTNALVIDLNAGPFPSIPVGGKVGGALSSQSAASRGNQITLKFTSALFDNTTTTTTSTNGTKVAVDAQIIDPDKLERFFMAVKKAGLVTR